MPLQIDPNDDPREPALRAPQQPSPPTHFPFHDHNPWRDMAPHPEEGNINHVSFSSPQGLHIQRTFVVQSGGPRAGQRLGAPVGDSNALVGTILQAAFRGIEQGAPPPQRHGHDLPPRSTFPHPQFGSPASVRTYSPNSPPDRFRANWPRNATSAGRFVEETGSRRFTPPHPGPQAPVPEAYLAFEAMVHAVMPDMHVQGPPNRNVNRGPGMPPFGLREILNQFFPLNPDAINNQEDFDRLMGQFMEASQGNDGPEPASDEAIAALPKRKIDWSMMGSDGTAECSVCIESVKMGEEVTVLPCQHWFHEQCVSMWLKSHDTCPHCRKGITPAEGQSGVPRSPGQVPRTDTSQSTQSPHGNGPGDPFTQPGMEQPYIPGGYTEYPEPQAFVQPPTPPAANMQPPPQHPDISRYSSRHSAAGSRGQSEGSRSSNNGNGGVTGWLRNLRGGGRNQD